MTSMPASRRARAMILAPRSWPSRPGLATTTRIFWLVLGADIGGGRAPSIAGAPERLGLLVAAVVRARDRAARRAARDHHVVRQAAGVLELDLVALVDRQ